MDSRGGDETVRDAFALLDALAGRSAHRPAWCGAEHEQSPARRLFGDVDGPDGSLAGADLPEVLFGPSERGAFHDVLGVVLAGASWEGESPSRRTTVRCRPTSPSARCATARGGRTTPATRTAGVRCAGAGRRRGRRGTASTSPERLTDRLTRLARVAEQLLAADDVEAVTKIVTGHMADAAGATVASLSVLVTEDRLRLLGIRGGRAGRRDPVGDLSVTPRRPPGTASPPDRPLILVGRDAIRSRYPHLESAAEGERSLVCLPLLVGERAIGAATMSFPGRREFDTAELDFFNVMADTCAQALDRVQALADVAAQSAKLAFLADATEELASSLDYESTLTNVARLAVPQIADWCAIALGIDGELRTLAVAHIDPEKVALAQEFQDRYPPDPEAPRGSYQVFRTGQSELTPEITDEMLEAADLEPEQRGHGPRS